MMPSIGTVPEWLATSSAPPSVGMLSMPRTSSRNHASANGSTAAISTSLIWASNPNSSTS